MGSWPSYPVDMVLDGCFCRGLWLGLRDCLAVLLMARLVSRKVRLWDGKADDVTHWEVHRAENWRLAKFCADSCIFDTCKYLT